MKITTVFSWTTRRRPCLLVSLALLAGLVGCESEDATPSAKDASTADTSTADTSTGDTTTGDTAADVAVDPNALPSGKWFLGVQAKPFGDLKLSFQLELTGTGTITAGGTYSDITIRAVGGDGVASEPLKSVQNIAVSAGGAFSAQFTDFTLPPSASPTGTPIPMQFTLKVTAMTKDGFCGDLEGYVPDFMQDLVGSKFAAAPFDTVTVTAIADKTYPSACAGGDDKIYDLIAVCPQLLPGTNTVTSAERVRSFEVVEPTGGSEGKPLVFLFHGVGGDPKSFLAETKFAETFGDAVVLVPSSERDSKGTAVLKTDWYYGAQKYDRDNPDLVFFDDLVKCASAQYKTDAKRIYVTGMSGGGMASTFIGLHRDDVVAAAAPFSGGYLHKFPADVQKIPFLISWGGPTDTAFSQNFDTMAKELRNDLVGNGNPVVECDHGEGHKWVAEATSNVHIWLNAFELGKAAPDLTALTAKLAAKSNCKVSVK